MLPDLSCPLSPSPPTSGDPTAFAEFCVSTWAAGQSCRETVDDYRALRARLLGAAP